MYAYYNCLYLSLTKPIFFFLEKEMNGSYMCYNNLQSTACHIICNNLKFSQVPILNIVPDWPKIGLTLTFYLASCRFLIMDKQSCILISQTHLKFISTNFAHKLMSSNIFMSFYLIFLVGDSCQQLDGHFSL